MATATKRIEKRSGDAGAGRAKAKAATKADPGPMTAECRRLAERLKIVADGTRIGVLLALADGERNVTDLTSRFGMTQAAVSHHLSLMRMAGVITPHRQGKSNFYQVTPLGRGLLAAVRAMIG